MEGTEDTVVLNLRRGSDQGFWCSLVLRMTQLWDFIDKRQIDVHVMSWSVFGLGVYVVFWTMEYAWAHPEKPGLELAAICAAILAPVTPMVAKVIDWYFRARQ